MLSFFNTDIIGPLLPIIMLCSGIFLLIRYKFFLIFHPIKIVKALFKKNSDKVSPFKAACIALSGTLGVGNIAGVAAAIAAGGAGAVFWMWVSAFFAMIIKYAEVCTAVIFKKDGHGGASYYIEQGLHCKKLARLFSVIIIFSSFCIGNIVQSSAAAEAINVSFGISKLTVGIVFAVITFSLLKGGINRIASFSSVVIPILSLGYVILSLAIIIKNRYMLPDILKNIISDAFNFSSVRGGILGIFTSKAIRFGASRGVLSNEAGCGTAAYAHSSANNDPVNQGLFGIFEVFVDTVLLCTLTAFVVLIAFPTGVCGDNGMQLATDAYSIAGSFGGNFVAISSAIYAVASVVCWSFYGSESLIYLSSSKNSRKLNCIYIIVYSFTGVLGAIFAPKLVWELADLSISAMAIINIICICLLSKYSAKITCNYFKNSFYLSSE